MEQDSFIGQLEKLNPEFSQYISPITENDRDQINSFFKITSTDSKDSLDINFEDSFEYIRLYFNSGHFQGFRFCDDESLLIFALECKKKLHFKLFKPLGKNWNKKLPEIIKLLSTFTNYPLQMVCLDNSALKDIRNIKQLELKSIKEFTYYIYDLSTLSDLSGNRWKNVRQKINNFRKNYPKLVCERLTIDNCNDTIHFIGAWRRYMLSKRHFSYSNLEKNKFTARFYSTKSDLKNIWATVYKLRGRVVAFQMLYRMGENSAAHVVGLADTQFKGLAETTQVDIWKILLNQGIRYINDGASWRAGLDRYKRKFNPVSAQKVFECKITLKGN